MDPIAPIEAAASLPVHDLSIQALFFQADLVVKAVMILLLLASMASWGIIFDKVFRIGRARREARLFESQVSRLTPLELHAKAADQKGMTARILSAGIAEWAEDRTENDRSESRAERRDRFERAMRLVMAGQTRRLESGLPFLATVGSAGPFIGLFGTVWGIMNSFTAIAGSQDTSLAVVAPGIAEALFATALGLVAAIPAVVAYNKLATGLHRMAQSFSAGISELAARLEKSRPGPKLA